MILSPTTFSLRCPFWLPPMGFVAEADFLSRHASMLSFFISRKRLRQSPPGILSHTEARLPCFPSLTTKCHANCFRIRDFFSDETRTTFYDAVRADIVDCRVRKLRVFVLSALAVRGAFVIMFKKTLAADLSVASAGVGVLESVRTALRGSWPKVLQIFQVFKDQGLILAALLVLSAFFSMAATSITTLWPSKNQLKSFGWFTLTAQIHNQRVFCWTTLKQPGLAQLSSLFGLL